MRRFFTRLAIGLAAAVVMSAVAPRTASAEVYTSFGCVAFENGVCTVFQYCVVDTGRNWWECADSGGGHQQGRIIEQIAQAAPVVRHRVPDAAPAGAARAGDVDVRTRRHLRELPDGARGLG